MDLQDEFWHHNNMKVDLGISAMAYNYPGASISPKPVKHVAFSPYFPKKYKFPYFRSIYVFCLIYVFCFPNFDPDAFIRRPNSLHVGYWTPLLLSILKLLLSSSSLHHHFFLLPSLLLLIIIIQIVIIISFAVKNCE